MLSPAAYVSLVRETFRSAGNPETARGQSAYMRHQFEYFGLKAPQWMDLAKKIHAAEGIPSGKDLENFAWLCYEDDHREMHYFALETVQKTMKHEPETLIVFLEGLICSRSWWDTVDWLAKLAGIHFKKYPHLIRPVTEQWMDSGNFWLQRVSMIFQLSYKEKTDAGLMFGYIRRLSGSREFFIQKGAGWALRQYSRTDPEAVRRFIETTPLAPLTKREGMRLILKAESHPVVKRR